MSMPQWEVKMACPGGGSGLFTIADIQIYLDAISDR